MDHVPTPSSSATSDLAFLDRLERTLGSLDRRIKIADLAVYTGASKSGAQALRERRARVLASPRMLDWISEARGRAASPRVERRLELLRRVTVDCQLEDSPSIERMRTSLQRAFSSASHRGKGAGANVSARSQALYGNEDRRERERAFYSLMGPDRALERRTLALIRARVERCRELGQGSLVSARLAMEGLTLGQWEDLRERLIPLLRARLRGRRDRFQRLTGEAGWYPWDERYLGHLEAGDVDRFFPAERAIESAARATKGWGFSRNAYRFTTQRAPIPFGGFAQAVQAPTDVRVIVNPRPGWSTSWKVMHEMGHAIQACLTTGESFLLRYDFAPSFGGLMEGMGLLFERIASSSGWLRTVPGLSAEQATEIQERAEEGFWWGLGMTMTHMEADVQAYLHPGRDPGRAMYRLEREIHGFDSYEPRMWADAIKVETPLYFKSYVLGGIVSTQVLRAGLDAVGGELWPNAKLGPWLTENWFAPGAAFDWMPRVTALTGHAIGVQDLTWN